VNVIVTPAATGLVMQNLTATAGAAMGTLGLSATGVLPSVVEIVSIGGVAGASTTVAFGNRAVLSETGIAVVVQNKAAAQTIPTPTFTLADTTNYRVDTNAGAGNDCADVVAMNGGLPGGTTCSFTVFFRPQALPAASVPAPNLASTMVVGGANTNLTLTLNGNAVSSLSSAPATGTFAAAVGATSAAQVFTITNSADAGTPASGILSVALAGAAPADYIITNDTCTGVTLASGANCAVTVAFRPTATGTRAATLSVDGATTDGVEVALSGTGS